VSSVNGLFIPGSVLSLLAVLNGALLRLRLSRYKRDCGLDPEPKSTILTKRFPIKERFLLYRKKPFFGCALL